LSVESNASQDSDNDDPEVEEININQVNRIRDKYYKQIFEQQRRKAPVNVNPISVVVPAKHEDVPIPQPERKQPEPQSKLSQPTGSSFKKPPTHRPTWQPDKQANFCNVDQKEFSLTVRKHHCRSCGLVICADCGKKMLLKNLKYDEPVITCIKCIATFYINQNEN